MRAARALAGPTAFSDWRQALPRSPLAGPGRNIREPPATGNVIAGAASFAAFSGAVHAGQGYALTTRLVAARASYDDAVAAAAKAMAGLGAGDPTNPGTICGPLISAPQRGRVQGCLDNALREGGRLATGGGRPADRDRGFFIEPTVIAGLLRRGLPKIVLLGSALAAFPVPRNFLGRFGPSARFAVHRDAYEQIADRTG